MGLETERRNHAATRRELARSIEREELDGCGAGSELDELEVTADADVATLVLYADVDPTDPAAIELRRTEWAEL